MKFIDESVIKVFAGKGGDGFVDFLKKFPHIAVGGSGGNGGSVYFKGSKKENTLLNVSSQKEYFAENGQKGKYQNSHGQNGQDLILEVPFGTNIFINGKLITKIETQIPFLVAKGGKGGRGNKLFKLNETSNKNYDFEEGKDGENFVCKLKLEVLADVGFVGKPSAGKSTILSVISNAKPKIADYDFTTIKPQLGLVRVSKNKSFVAADLPGLIARYTTRNEIENKTLKTISKCKGIAYVIDFGSDTKNPLKDFVEIKNELIKYSNDLKSLPFIIIANKMDSLFFYENLKKFKQANPDQEIVKISALMKKNIKELKHKLFNLLNS